MHQVPVLLDGDFVISESRAIMTYLVNSKKPGNSFYPSEAKARALIDQRLYFEAINFFELAASILVRNWILLKKFAQFLNVLLTLASNGSESRNACSRR